MVVAAAAASTLHFELDPSKVLFRICPSVVLEKRVDPFISDNSSSLQVAKLRNKIFEAAHLLMSDAELIASTLSTSPVETTSDIPAATTAPLLASNDTLIPPPTAAAAVSNPNSGARCRCEVCGISGTVSNFYSPRFCSRECRYERNKGNHVLPRPDIGIITCRECGKVGSSTEFFSAKYCSKKCRYERGGRPPPQSRSNEVDASGDSTATLDLRLKAKRDIAAQRLSASLPSEPNAVAPPRATGFPMLASIPRGFNPSSFHTLQSSAAGTAIDSSSNYVAATVAANWQLLVDYQPRDKDQTPSLFYLLDAVAALQESIVRASLDCVREETLLEATNRRLQELENDINACIAGASDAVSLEDRKSYYDIIRKMWADRALLQKDELRILEQLRKQQESKGKLRAQLLDKEQSLLTLGLTVLAFRCFPFAFDPYYLTLPLAVV